MAFPFHHSTIISSNPLLDNNLHQSIISQFKSFSFLSAPSFALKSTFFGIKVENKVENSMEKEREEFIANKLMLRDHVARKQEGVWRNLLFSKNSEKTSSTVLGKKAKKEVRKGVPSSFRCLVWQFMSGSNELLEKNQGKYQRLLEKLKEKERLGDEEKLWQCIRDDVNRTFPQFEIFQTHKQLQLESVLKVYAKYNSKIGYCQGENFVCGMLLLFMDEESAFWTFVSLMENYRLEALFLPGFPYLNCCFFIFSKLLQSKLPKLHIFLVRPFFHFPPSFFTSSALFTFASF